MSDQSSGDKDGRELQALSSLSKLAEENQQLRDDYNKLRKNTIRLAFCGLGLAAVIFPSNYYAYSSYKRIENLEEIAALSAKLNAGFLTCGKMLEHRLIELELATVSEKVKTLGTIVSNYQPSRQEIEALEKIVQVKEISNSDFSKNSIKISNEYGGGFLGITTDGYGFLLTNEGHFVTSYRAIQPAIFRQLWQIIKQEDKQFPVVTTITADGQTYDFEDFLIIDPHSDLAIGKARVPHPLDIQQVALLNRDEIEGLPVVIYGDQKSQGQISRVDDKNIYIKAKVQNGYGGSAVCSEDRLIGILFSSGKEDTVIGTRTAYLKTLIERYCANKK